ncbi:MAG: protein kinase [Gemmataceae bacterium]
MPAKLNLDFLDTAQQPDELGRFGSYRVLEVLGVGGMGVVLLAEDPVLKRRVAIKVMKPELAAEEENRQRFLREARAAAAVEHPYIVPIYQVGEVERLPYLAMPLLKGESLDTRIKREKQLPVADAVRIARQIAEGLAAAHDQGLIHRDIKPGNIWLDEKTGQAKLLDFGLARHVADDTQLTTPGTVVGTPAYMAPEQAANKPLDHRCDLFSLGTLLYRMLTGELPFSGTDTMSMLVMLATETPIPPRERNPSVPVMLNRLVLQMLAKEAAERPASAHLVVTALNSLESGPHPQPELPRRPEQHQSSSDDKTQRLGGPAALTDQPASARRKNVFIGLAALVFLGAVISGLVGFFHNRDGSAGKDTLPPEGKGPDGGHKDGNAKVGPNEKLAAEQLAVAKWLMEDKKLKFIGIEKDGHRVITQTLPAPPFKVLELNLYPAYASSFSAEDLARLHVFADLEKLNLSGQQVTNESLGRLTSLVNLRSLSLNSTQITPAAAETLLRFPKLEELGVTDLGTEEALKTLAGLPALKSLLLGGDISDKSLRWIEDFPRLTQLKLLRARVSEAALLRLKVAKQLRLLAIDSPAIRTETFEQLAKDMPWCEIHDRRDNEKPVIYNKGKAEEHAVIQWLFENKGLQSLQVERVDGKLVKVESAPTFAFKLRELNLHPMNGATFTAEELERITSLVDLEVLNLAGQSLTDKTLSHLVSLVHLRKLEVDPTTLTSAAIQTLRRFPQLEELAVSNGDDAWVKGLDQLPDLQTLRLYRTKVSAQTMRALSSFPKLRHLSLSQTSTSEADLLQLREAKQLRLLDIHSAELDKGVFKRLAQAMPWCEIRDYREQDSPIIYNKGKATGIQ